MNGITADVNLGFYMRGLATKSECQNLILEEAQRTLQTKMKLLKLADGLFLNKSIFQKAGLLSKNANIDVFPKVCLN